MLSGKHFFVDIPETAGTQPSGCGTTDCRVPNWFGIWH